jgi:phosphoribosylaminoimidazole-succinocarboxamide synthase
MSTQIIFSCIAEYQIHNTHCPSVVNECKLDHIFVNVALVNNECKLKHLYATKINVIVRNVVCD